ncbi:MAG: type II toxin-antitoxin system Phd/YefM family antitoxin [Clostridiales Family XIII bacterium]|jgi:antitoxin (DNA-binding transcriptional repressor) of toxin-antitoxin stability system|nr:type II toxin-antitoxin system Phd/YefM family antitoxin [Clostridiales Family XIII bacterium]
MPQVVNMQEAKTHLSKLVSSLKIEKTVIIANRGVPVAKLEPITDERKRPLGFVSGKLPESFFDPLPEEDLESWML